MSLLEGHPEVLTGNEGRGSKKVGGGGEHAQRLG